MHVYAPVFTTLLGLTALAASHGVDASAKFDAEEPEGDARNGRGGGVRGGGGGAGQGSRRLAETGRVIVKRKTEASLRSQGKSWAEIDDIRARGRGAIAKEKTVFEDPALGIQVVDVGRGNEQSFVDRMTKGPDRDLYEYVEVDHLVSPADRRFANDPYDCERQAWQHDAMDSPSAWYLHTGGPSVTVAICDTGLQLDHPDLAGNRVEGYNAVTRKTESQGGDVSPINGNIPEWNSHGTNCAGLAAAIGNNNRGIAGVGWNFKHRPIQVSTDDLNGNAYTSTLAHCARWACDRGDIVSMSFAGVQDASRRDAAAYCRTRRSLLFNSAGNKGLELSGDSGPLVVVGASDYNHRKTTFSNYGSYVDIYAPGEKVFTTTTGSGYAYTTGTSFACPLAAGLAALIWSAKPCLTPDDVEKVIKETLVGPICETSGSCNSNNNIVINSHRALRHPLVGLDPVRRGLSPDPGGRDDPHFTTWKGERYDYHGQCDLIYTTCPSFDNNKGLRIHLRTKHVEPKNWSTITNLAVKIGQDTFELQSDGTYRINSEVNPAISDTTNLAGHGMKRGGFNHNGNIFTIALDDDLFLDVTHFAKTLKTNEIRNSLAFKIRGVQQRGKRCATSLLNCVGLSSTWDHPEGDWFLVGRSGTRYTRYDASFGNEWQVDLTKGDPMLFAEDIGQQLPDRSCIDGLKDAGRRQLEGTPEGDAVIRQAEDACRHLNGGNTTNDTHTFEECVYDVIVTGDVSFAEDPWYNDEF